MPELTARQKKFAEYYVKCGNATQSAKKAGYSQKYAGNNANKLLKNTNIANYIRDLQQKWAEKTGVTADCVLDELKEVAFSDTKISGREKMKALELIGKHLGIFDGQNQESGEKQLTNLFEIIEEGISKK